MSRTATAIVYNFDIFCKQQRQRITRGTERAVEAQRKARQHAADTSGVEHVEMRGLAQVEHRNNRAGIQ